MLRTGGRNDRKILNAPTGADAQDRALYRCQYTGKEVAFGEHIYLGACIPQVRGAYVCHTSAKDAYRDSKRCFDEFEANCNTCQSLERVPHDKGALMRGRCTNPTAAFDAHPYRDLARDGVMVFHPDDHMGMPCHQPRCPA
ncbi:MAG: hypothetical protein H0W48_00100 [Methylibium sp.]|nr:hypothetical protein [Methylibium sp.]